MDDRDLRAIEELFQKLRTVESQSAPRDPEAERYIRDQIARQPGAPYYMAQTIIVQEQALAAAQQRIEALEERGAGRPTGGGLLGGLFGSGRPEQSRGAGQYGRSADYGRSSDRGGGPWGGAYGRGGGGGFLAGAAQTAMGVAGGVLLGNMIADVFNGDAEAGAGDLADASGMEDQDVADVGADADFGDFDMG